MATVIKHIKRTFVKASTLPEAIISLVIISIISGLAIMVIMNVTESANNQLKILGIYQLENILSGEQDFTDEDFQVDNIKIEKTCVPFEGNNTLMEIHYKVFSKQDKSLFEIKEIKRKNQ